MGGVAVIAVATHALPPWGARRNQLYSREKDRVGTLGPVGGVGWNWLLALPAVVKRSKEDKNILNKEGAGGVQS